MSIETLSYIATIAGVLMGIAFSYYPIFKRNQKERLQVIKATETAILQANAEVIAKAVFKQELHDRHDRRLDALEDNYKKLNHRIANFKSESDLAMTELKQEIEKIFDSLEGKLNSLEGKLDGLIATLLENALQGKENERS